MACNMFQESFSLVLAFFWSLRFCFSEAQMVPAMFVFGDSLVDVGNNNYLFFTVAKANYPHHGVDFPTRIPTGRFSNGKNTADFLAEKVGLPTSPPYLSIRDNENRIPLLMNGVSFASSGSGILSAANQVIGQVIQLTEQVDGYATVHEELVKELGSGGAQQHLSNSLFVVGIGSNDIFNYLGSFDLRNRYTPNQYVTLMTDNLQQQLRRLYENGGRKFVVLGLGQVGCTPALRAMNQAEECNEEANEWAVDYNGGLKMMLQGLKSELNDFSYSYSDTYPAMQNIINNPTAYGLTEVREACCGLGRLRAMIPCLPISTYCGNREDHLFWDFTHPTQAAASIFVDFIFDGPSNYTFPINVRQLVTV